MKSKLQFGTHLWCLVMVVVIMLGEGNRAQVRAFTHPGIPLTIGDLAYVKTNLTESPWREGYAALVASGLSSTNYTMAGPFTYVNRNAGGNFDNEWQWQNDMRAVYNLARMWYFTGDANYAKKSRDILIAWANTQTNFGGVEASFDVGGSAYQYAGGADILRATWPGWTAADTATVSAYFTNVLWRTIEHELPVAWYGSQGGEALQAGIAIAVFCDDTNKFNQMLYMLLNDAGTGFRNTYANGEVSDNGRDQGHSALYVQELAWVAEVCWKQGLDVFSIYDQRIHACAEYHSRFNGALTLQTNLPFVPIGASTTNCGTPGTAFKDGIGPCLVHTAYATRLGVQTPYVDLAGLMTSGMDNFMNYRLVDPSTATPVAALNPAATASLSTGLTSADLNGCIPAGSTSYSSGTWTLRGGFNNVDPYNSGAGNDTVRFAYKQLTGDFTFIARVDSVSNVGSAGAKAGLMMRDALANASIREWVAITPGVTSEFSARGFSVMPYVQGTGQSGNAAVKQVPYWVKMERQGNRIYLFKSLNGGDWEFFVSAFYNNLPSTLYVGLFETSLVVNTLNTATFSNVRITGGDGGEALKTPPAPFAVYASPGVGQVPLHWNESFTATNYTVWRSTINGGPYSQVVAVTNTCYVDTNVVAGTTYYYVVKAANSAGTSTNSIQDSATVVAAPPAPAILTAAVTNGRVALNWSAAAGATSYHVKRSTTSGSGYVQVGTSSDTSYLDTVPALNQMYYYVVSSDLNGGEGVNSAELGVWVNATPQAYLKFNESSGTTATDSTFNGWNGTLVNGATFAAGYSSNAVSLTAASSQYVTLPTGVVNGLTSCTIAAWVKPASLSSWARIFDFGTGTANYMFLTPQNGATSTLRFAINAGGGEQQINSSSTLPLNTWSHVAVTLNGAVGVMYLNGVAVGTNSAMTLNPSSLGATTQNYLGKSQFAADPYFNGLVDEFRIYNRTLSASDVAALAGSAATLGTPTNVTLTVSNLAATVAWNPVAGVIGYNVLRSFTSGGPYAVVGTVLGTNFTDISLVRGQKAYYVVAAFDSLNTGPNSAEVSAWTPATLQAYLKMDESSGTNAADATGNGWNGTLLNGTIFAAGYSSNAVSLTASNSQYVTLPTGVVSGLTSCTIAAWINPTTASTWARIFDFGTGTDNYMFLAVPNTPRFGIVTGGGGREIVGTAGVVPNAWSHIAVTLSGGVGILYLNGVAIGTNSAMVWNASSLGATTQNCLGKSKWNDPYFDGLIDEFRIYNGVLSASDVASLVTPLSAPGNFTASVSNNAVQLKWNSVSLASGYKIFRSLTNGGPYQMIGMVAGTNYTDANVALGQTNYYVVTAINNAVASPNSSQASAVVLPPLPATPTNLVAVAGNSQVVLTWSAVTNATGFNVKFSLTSGGSYSVIATNWAGLSFTNTGLANGTNYYYVVSAANAAGESANSSQVSARPVSNVSSPLQVNVVPGQIQLNWPADHIGWRLQMTTNLANASWVDVSSNLVTSTNQFFIPLSPTNPNAFYRLIYP